MKQYRYLAVSLAAMVALAGCTTTVALTATAVTLTALVASDELIDAKDLTESQREYLRKDSTISGKFGSGTANFGNATKANMASHIIDPAPAYAADPPKIDGQIIISGYGRYRTGKVKPPAPIGSF